MPRFIGRLSPGRPAYVMMTELRGASNVKAKRELPVASGSRELAIRVRNDLVRGGGRAALLAVT